MAGFEHEPALAVLVDIENMARPGARNRGEFDIHLVLDRLAEKGRVVVKRAYADWSRYRDARRELMNAGLELIEMPSAREGAKNRADIKMAVDAMEIAYSRSHVTTFVIVSGDSDFTPLIGKLRELNKQVIGIGRDESSASSLLIANCDVFYFYDSMASKAPARSVEGVRPDALSLLRETLTARQHEGDEHPQASAVKDSMRRRDPAFSESDIGFSTFSKFLEDAQSKGVVKLTTDVRSGTYLVELTDSDGQTPGWPSVSDDPPVEISEGRRRRRRRRGGDNGNGTGDLEIASTTAGGDDTPEAEAAESGAEVFEWKVPEREPELPPLDQPLTYEDVLLPADAELTPAAAEPPTRGSRRRRKALSAVPEPEAADLETGADPEPAAAADPDEVAAEDAAVEAPATEEAPKRRSRVKRGTVLPTVTEDGSATEEAADEPPAEEEKPKRRRTTRKKTEEATADEPAADEAAEAALADEEKPKPRRTPRKKATDEAAPSEATEAAASEATADAEEKPKRRRAPRKKATDEAAPSEATEEAAAAEATADAEEKPKRRRTVRRKATEEPAGETAPPEESGSGLKPGVSPY